MENEKMMTPEEMEEQKKKMTAGSRSGVGRLEKAEMDKQHQTQSQEE